MNKYPLVICAEWEQKTTLLVWNDLKPLYNNLYGDKGGHNNEKYSKYKKRNQRKYDFWLFQLWTFLKHPRLKHPRLKLPRSNEIDNFVLSYKELLTFVLNTKRGFFKRHVTINRIRIFKTINKKKIFTSTLYDVKISETFVSFLIQQFPPDRDFPYQQKQIILKNIHKWNLFCFSETTANKKLKEKEVNKLMEVARLQWARGLR